MRHVWMAGLALMSAMAVSGCVSDKKYHEALADADATRGELERSASAGRMSWSNRSRP